MHTHGLVNTFHALLLCPHYPNDDRQFPGHQYHQLPGFGDNPYEWAVGQVLSHVGHGTKAKFEVQWSTGDVTWLLYANIKHLQPLIQYYKALGIPGIHQLHDNDTAQEHLPALSSMTG